MDNLVIKKRKAEKKNNQEEEVFIVPSQNSKMSELRRSGNKTGPKKLVIKNLKSSTNSLKSSNFEEDSWKLLEEAIQSIYSQSMSKLSLEELYKTCEDMCIQKLSSSLYSKVELSIETHIKSLVPSLVSHQTQDHQSFLSLVNQTWSSHCEQTRWIRSIFLYLDRTYAVQTASVRPIWDLGLFFFRTHLVQHPEIGRKILDGILQLVKAERMRDTIPKSLVRDLIRMYTSLGIYLEAFQNPFLQETKKFYAEEGSTLIDEIEPSQYLLHVESRLEEEVERIHHYLLDETLRPLIEIIDEELLKRNIDLILEKGFGGLISNNKHQDLKRLYTLFSRVTALQQIEEAFHNYIKTTGTPIIQDVQREKTMVQELLELKEKMTQTLDISFGKNPQFLAAMKRAFQTVVNSKPNRPAELIAKYVDSQLRSGSKTATSDDERDILFDKVIYLFKCLHAKDIFEAFYKKDLARRLILQKSISMDAEESFIMKLKAECGNAFTLKLEGMFKDMDLSKELMKEFKSKEFDLLGIDVSVFVLTTGYWPKYQEIQFSLPQEFAHIQEMFKKFYSGKYNGRRLVWNHHNSQCVVKAHFPSSKKELSVSFWQSLVLLQFNNQTEEEIPLASLRNGTGLPENILIPVLESLACGKVHPLSKNPASNSISDEDKFSINKSFKQKMYKIKINAIQMKETQEEQKKTHESVFKDRQYQIDAAIVRIMKTRQTLSHTELLAEVFKQVKFPVKPSDIKKRIESLIEREYIDRTSSDMSIQQYVYLA